MLTAFMWLQNIVTDVVDLTSLIDGDSTRLLFLAILRKEQSSSDVDEVWYSLQFLVKLILSVQ
jgi:hypothetical protein